MKPPNYDSAPGVESPQVGSSLENCHVSYPGAATYMSIRRGSGYSTPPRLNAKSGIVVRIRNWPLTPGIILQGAHKQTHTHTHTQTHTHGRARSSACTRTDMNLSRRRSCRSEVPLRVVAGKPIPATRRHLRAAADMVRFPPLGFLPPDSFQAAGHGGVSPGRPTPTGDVYRVSLRGFQPLVFLNEKGPHRLRGCL